MSLKDFQTILVPSNKTGALQFYHKSTKTILEAAFSRPDVGATSGSSVFDKNGEIKENDENEPDWNFPIEGGCPSLLMRPQAQNLMKPISSFNTSLLVKSNPSTADNQGVEQTQFAVTTGGVNQAFGDLTIAVNESTKYYWWAVFESAGINDLSFALVDDSSPISLISYNTDDNSTTKQTGNFSNVHLEDLGNGSYKLSGMLTTGAGQTTIAPRIRVLTLAGGSNVTANGQILKISQIQITEGPRKEDYIPPATSPLTRSANSITWNNMQLAGVLGSDSGAWLIKLKDFESWANISTFLRLDGNGSDTLRLSARTGNQLLLLFDAGLGTNSLGAAFSGKDAVISVTYNATWLRLFVGSSKHAEIEHGGSLQLENLRTNIASAFADIALMAFNPVFLDDNQMIQANAEVQNL